MPVGIQDVLDYEKLAGFLPVMKGWEQEMQSVMDEEFVSYSLPALQISKDDEPGVRDKCRKFVKPKETTDL